MPVFRVKSRKIGPITLGDVTADSREHAINLATARAGEGESIEVLDAQQLSDDMIAPAGVSRK
jgi:hypothetical protein